MDNIESYESIARADGWKVFKLSQGYVYWDGYVGKGHYTISEEAWKACCVENELS